MDDCTLSKLKISPGILKPPFKKETTEYDVLLGSEEDHIKFDCLTNDTGASYLIADSGGSKTIPLKEGAVNEIRIEVTAEDGTIKNYIVRAKRLSGKDASLQTLTVNQGVLEPEFRPEIKEYSCLISCLIDDVTVNATSPDKKAKVRVEGDEPGKPITLNLSDTHVNIEVISPDNSHTLNYTVLFTKKQILRFILIKDPELAFKFECPISLAPLYQPISIKGSDPKHTFTGPIIDDFTRLSKYDPLSELPLEAEWRFHDFKVDHDMSNADACFPLSNGEFSVTKTIAKLGDILLTCNSEPKIEGIAPKYSSEAPVGHKIQLKPWEKQLRQIFDEKNSTKLVKNAEAALAKYFDIVPSSAKKVGMYERGESPLDYLKQASFCYATALSGKDKDANLHLRLGFVLEEKYYIKDALGIKISQDHDVQAAGTNTEAKESGKEEECLAICRLRGVSVSAPLSQQLKAIDEEYKHLLDSGQSGKADHVQNLYIWKNKQATKEGATAQKAADEESELGQAYSKYLDALALDENKSVYHFHVGRMLVVQGKYEEAIKRLGAALALNEKHQMAKFYLGLALCQVKGGPGDRANEGILYLAQVMEALLAKKAEESSCKDPEKKPEKALYAENLLQATNVCVLRGLVELGKALLKNSQLKKCMAGKYVLHNAALMASSVMPDFYRGDTYQQVEWILMDAHYALLEYLLANDKNNFKVIGRRCECLSALIKRATIAQCQGLTLMQQKTCEAWVFSQPCNSHALYMLGQAQLAHYDSDPKEAGAAQLLEDSIKTFQCSISLEKKHASGDPPDAIKEQSWWVAKIKPPATKPAGKEPPKKAVGGAAAKGPAKGPTSPATKAGSASKGKPPAKAPVDPRKASTISGTSMASRASTVGHKRVSSAKSSGVDSAPPTTPSTASLKVEIAPVNKKTYHARLGLARAFNRKEDIKEAQKFYDEVMHMAPEIHDAYIECAEMLVKEDPMAAVAVYSRFPKSKEPNFNDAYIFGEIVRLLIKQEQYDDLRLKFNMIELGKVMGMGVLEKYVQILDDKFKTDVLKEVYCGVHGKEVDDPEMIAFFKFKCWM